MNPDYSTNQSRNISLHKAALIAGLGLVIMTIFAIIPHNFILPELIIPENLKTTIDNIEDEEFLFRFSIFSYLIVIICDIVVAWGLYIFLKPVHENLSLLAAWFRLVYSVIFAVALASYLNVLDLFPDPDYLKILTEIEINQLHSQIESSINSFSDTWSIGYIFFGIHLILLGNLVFKSNYVHKAVGVLLILGGLSYSIDYFGKILLPNIDFRISTFFGWGELVLMVWLLLKGIKIRSNEI